MSFCKQLLPTLFNVNLLWTKNNEKPKKTTLNKRLKRWWKPRREKRKRINLTHISYLNNRLNFVRRARAPRQPDVVGYACGAQSARTTVIVVNCLLKNFVYLFRFNWLCVHLHVDRSCWSYYILFFQPPACFFSARQSLLVVVFYFCFVSLSLFFAEWKFFARLLISRDVWDMVY